MIQEHSKDYFKYPRLYIKDSALAKEAAIALDHAQSNYLGNVLRRKAGDVVRIFNGRDGEFLAEITDISRKAGIIKLVEPIRAQPAAETRVHLLFAPLKKNRMDLIIEKCTELGVTDFHPILTHRTEVREINQNRLQAQIEEAAEQSERLSIPVLHDLEKMERKIALWKETESIAVCLERHDAPAINTYQDTHGYAFLVGPVGGFDEAERQMLLSAPRAAPYSLGENVLRAETACMMCATVALLNRAK